jgi:hypothetical protein
MPHHGRYTGPYEPYYYVFDLKSRTWWDGAMKAARSNGEDLVYVVMADDTWGYRRLDGSWLWRSTIESYD